MASRGAVAAAPARPAAPCHAGGRRLLRRPAALCRHVGWGGGGWVVGGEGGMACGEVSQRAVSGFARRLHRPCGTPSLSFAHPRRGGAPTLPLHSYFLRYGAGARRRVPCMREGLWLAGSIAGTPPRQACLDTTANTLNQSMQSMQSCTTGGIPRHAASWLLCAQPWAAARLAVSLPRACCSSRRRCCRMGRSARCTLA